MPDTSPRFARRLQFATTVMAYAEHHGVTVARAYEWATETFESFEGRIPTYEAFRTFIWRYGDRVRRDDALTDEISAVFQSLAGIGEGGTGGSSVPSAIEGTEERTRRDARQLDTDERERFIRETIATLEKQYRKDPAMITAVFRHYAELMAGKG